MKVSWKFFAALVAGFVLMLGVRITVFYLNLGVPSEQSRWAFELYQKKRLLASETKPPKLLLVGGSATLFGLSAREIESESGYRTINIGNHAALGTACLLHQAQEMAKPGDTVLLVLEYELYTFGKVEQAWADKILVDYLVSRDPGFFHSLTVAEQWTVFMLTTDDRLVRGLKYRWRHGRTERPRSDDSSVYSIKFINEWGDQTHNRRAARPDQRDQVWQNKSILGHGLPARPQGFAVIESFCRWAQTQHIRVLATFPNLCDQPEYHMEPAKQAAATIKDFFSGLGVPVVGDYTDAMLPADDFFDTTYHLTEEAAQTRSQRLAAQLIPWLK